MSLNDEERINSITFSKYSRHFERYNVNYCYEKVVFNT